MSFFNKRGWLAGGMALMLLPWAKAQSGDNQQSDRPPQAQPRQQQQQRMAMLAERLNLTDDQKQQWIEIQRETTQKVRAARQDGSLSEEQMQARLKEIHKQQRDQVFAMLSPEQQESLKAFWEEQKQKRQPAKAADNSTPSETPAETKEREKENDLFAGMVSDDPVSPPPQPPQSKKAGRK
jgi:periplasmic protein CpxP/Spy